LTIESTIARQGGEWRGNPIHLSTMLEATTTTAITPATVKTVVMV
jgi:hypothetical protein